MKLMSTMIKYIKRLYKTNDRRNIFFSSRGIEKQSISPDTKRITKYTFKIVQYDAKFLNFHSFE